MVARRGEKGRAGSFQRAAQAAAVVLLACGSPQRPATGPVPGISTGPGASEPAASKWSAMSVAEVDAAIEAMDRGALETAFAEAGSGAAARHIAARLAWLAGHTGDLEAARRWRQAAGDRAPPAPSPRPRLDPIEVALVLPLSGEHARLGAEIRAAVDVARADARIASVAVFDTAGTEPGATAAVEAAIAGGANLILGPVGQRESRAAAARAVAAGVPIALLSPAEHGAAPQVGVYRLWPSPEHQAELAAAVAVELGYEALAVLAPRDELGAAASEAFARRAKALGAEVVASGRYDPTATELEPDIKAFLGLDPATNARLRRHLRRRGRERGWKSFSPDVKFEVLYIPDRYDRAALVAGYLPYFNVELRAGGIVDTLALRRKHGGRLPSVVQLLGSDGWHHPSLIARGGAAVDGALIVAVCVGGPNEDYLDDTSARIAARLRRAIGRPPSAIASQAYDAARLVFERVKRRRRSGPRVLAGARLTAGACGPAAVDRRGQLRRQPMLMRVEIDQLVPHVW